MVRKLTKCIMLSLMCWFGVVSVTACGKKEAVITDEGSDITESVKVYDELDISTAKKFSYDDLTVGNLKLGATIQEVEAAYGKPDKVTEVSADEKTYVYSDRVIEFCNINGNVGMASIESGNPSDVFSRGLSVGMTMDDILKVYYRDIDCMNNTFYSTDRTAQLGKYLYGNYTMDSFDTVKPDGKVEYGVINYNGYASYEEAESLIVEYTYFEPPYISGVASASDDMAQLALDIDDAGKITAIRWYYYPEIKE